MTKENSPIATIAMPVIIDERASVFATYVAVVTLNTLPTMKTVAIMIAGSMFCSTSRGSISMPMETKNTAMNISLMGMVLSTISFCAVDWETITPITNAPIATLSPISEEISAMPKQRPSDTSSSTSLE